MTTKDLNPYLVGRNTNPETYYPSYYDEESAEVFDDEPIYFAIDEVKYFETARSAYDYDFFQAKRIGLNKFLLSRYQVKVKETEKIVWQTSIINGSVFCPLILEWECKERSAAAFEKMKKNIISLLTKPPLSAVQFTTT